MRQFFSFVRKEFFHIFRDVRTMLILLVMPVLLILLFGYAVTNEVKTTRVAVLDFSRGSASRQLAERFSANEYFDIASVADTYAEVEEGFLSGDIDMALVFPHDFGGRAAHNPDGAVVQLLIDGSEPNQASVRSGYAGQIVSSWLQDNAAEYGVRGTPPVRTEVRMLHNPQQKSGHNFVPGVMGLIILLLCTLMTSISIVREKETGTMEILLVSPLPPVCIILAKLVPYFVISLVNLGTILALSYFLLDIPMAGSMACLLLLSIVYIIVSLSLGLLISTCVGTQLAAMLLSLLLIVPAIYLSGLVFQLDSMPVAAQNISAIVPTRWFIDGARRLMIQGAGIRHVMKDILALAAEGTVLITLSLSLFKTKLE